MPRAKFSLITKNLHPSACGGQLRNFRKGRGKRSISFKFSMHVVLRSLLARGVWSFSKKNNRELVNRILKKHAERSGVKLMATGNAGNHLHLRIKTATREQYFHFIRAIAGEIALKIKKIPRTDGIIAEGNFWSSRPFSAIVATFKYAERLAEYIRINHLEGRGFSRDHARFEVEWERHAPKLPSG